MRLLFAGDLSFDWLPKPSLSALIGQILKGSGSTVSPELHTPRVTRARILAQARQISRGLRDVIAGADHFCVNLECALSDRGQALDQKRYTMRALPHYVLALQEMGVTLACLANNHVLDYGPDGLADTIHSLDRAQIQHCGLRQTAGSQQTPAVLTKDSERVAVFNFVEPRIIDPNPDLYFAHEPCPFPLDPALALETVAVAARSMPVVVVLHWGEEWSYLESNAQREVAHALIDAGASAVIGHHSHLAGVVEEYKGRPIAYSLGNLFLQLPPFSTGRSAPRYMIDVEFGHGSFHKYGIATVEPDDAGLPVSPASFESTSVFGDYWPSAIPKSGPIYFDSAREIEKATVIISREGVRHETRWSGHYLLDRTIVEGKVPVGPGWRCDDIYWSGIARHRDYLAPEFLAANLAHTFDDVTLYCRLKPVTPFHRLFVIAGRPELFSRRKKFSCPKLTVHLNDRLLFAFNRENPSSRWTVQELPLDQGANDAGDLVVTVEGVKGFYGYLNWRLIGI